MSFMAIELVYINYGLIWAELNQFMWNMVKLFMKKTVVCNLWWCQLWLNTVHQYRLPGLSASNIHAKNWLEYSVFGTETHWILDSSPNTETDSVFDSIVRENIEYIRKLPNRSSIVHRLLLLFISRATLCITFWRILRF